MPVAALAAVPLLAVLPTLMTLLSPDALIRTLPRMRPLLLIVMPPLLPADRSMASAIEVTEAPVSGNRVVLAAWMRPALVMVLRLPPRSTIASETRLKGEFEGAIVLVGEMVLVLTDATMLALWLTVISATLEFLSRMTPKA